MDTTMDNEIYHSRPNVDVVPNAKGIPAVPRKLSPISSLSADILLEIFRTNADMDQDCLFDNEPIERDACRAINATRILSQVSSSWRDLTINAPILWANLIDLDFLHGTHLQWREIVIWRAQNSPLHVKGSISLMDLDHSDPWWLEFFRSCWPRIRKLDLDVRSGVHYSTPLNDADMARYRKGLSFLSQSTPTLQFFCIQLQNQCNPLGDGSMLFNNRAPRLRHLETENMHFTIESTWLSQLHSLHICRHNGEIFPSVDALYQTLSQMKHLESLDLNQFTTSPYIGPHRVPIHLPRLKFFQFRTPILRLLDFSDTPPYWPLFHHIILEPGCSVRVMLQDLSLSNDIDSSVLFRLVKNYFEVHQPTHLSLSTHDYMFSFTNTIYKKLLPNVDKTPFAKSMPKPPFFFLFLHFKYFAPPPPEDMRMYRLFKELFVLSFPAVVELDLDVSYPHIRSFTDQQFGRLLSSFTALKKLTASSVTLQHLYASQTISISTLFPLLEVLENYAQTSTLLAEILVPFFQLRKEAGVPIPIFSYRCASYSKLFGILDDLTTLDSTTGLKVVWELGKMGCGEYICGSGAPEVLNFSGRASELLAPMDF